MAVSFAPSIASPNVANSSLLLRSRSSARWMAARSRLRSPSAVASSWAASRSSAGRAARLITRSGFSGSSTAVTSSAIPPPRNASTKRGISRFWVDGLSVTISTAVAAAWMTMATLAPAKIVSRIATVTTRPSCHAPVPSR